MKTTVDIQVRDYLVEIRDEREGKTFPDHIVLDKPRLQAAALVGLTDKDLIYQLYNRQGYRVLNICPPTKRTLTVALDGEV